MYSNTPVRKGFDYTALFVGLVGLKEAAHRPYKLRMEVFPDALPVPIFLTRPGLPRIIPSFHRYQIQKRDDEVACNRLVRLAFSIFIFGGSSCLNKRPRVHLTLWSRQ